MSDPITMTSHAGSPTNSCWMAAVAQSHISLDHGLLGRPAASTAISFWVTGVANNKPKPLQCGRKRSAKHEQLSVSFRSARHLKAGFPLLFTMKKAEKIFLIS